MTPLLEAKSVTKIFSTGMITKESLVALEDFSLTIGSEEPTIIAIVGESGSGKTTLANILLGLIAPTKGEVLYRGQDLQRMSKSDWQTFRREVQVIFQDPYEVYNPFYKVDHALTMPIRKFHLAHSKKEEAVLIEEVLEAVGLRTEGTLGRYPHELSGGQRQRVMVARALLMHPRLIIADEPVSMVDASLRATILGSLRQMNLERGISIIYITHDLTTAYQICENIIVLYSGSIVEVGDVELVIQQPEHPYTKLLVASVPQADPTHKWKVEDQSLELTSLAIQNKGCNFANRCPFVMKQCLDSPPLLYQTSAHRATACFQYQDSSTLRMENVRMVSTSATSVTANDHSVTIENQPLTKSDK